VRIPLAAFVMTNRGRVVERRMEMTRDKVMSLGVSISAQAVADGAGPAAAGGGPAAPAAGGADSGGAAAAAAGAGAPGDSQAASGGGGGGEAAEPAVSREFRLLLREIRADGRAGDTDYPEQ
jgi:hypothetical protein